MNDSATPLVTVVMNCFNGEIYLREAVDSLLQQSYENWELIFWDNQSQDSSAAIIHSYDDPRICYCYAEQHTGLGEARSQALAQAKGEWIGFLDVDDLWFRDKLTRQVDEIIKVGRQVGMAYCRCEYFRDVKQQDRSLVREKKICPGSETLPQENLADELYLGNLIPFPSLLYKKEALNAIGGIPPYKHPPDYYMSLAIASRYEVVAVDEVLCGYRLHDSNLSWSIKEDGYREPIDIVRKVAPEGERIHLSRFNVTRYVAYLLKEQRWSDAWVQISTIGIFSLIGGLVGLLRYRRRYGC